jgi:hypothetical protein
MNRANWDESEALDKIQARTSGGSEKGCPLTLLLLPLLLVRALVIMAAKDPAARRVNASIAANERWSRVTNRAQATAAARAAGTNSLDYWEKQVDPDREMTPADRVKAAENARRAYYQRFAKQGRAAQIAQSKTSEARS